MVDLEGLEEFSRMPDRDRAPFLTGRSEEMDMIKVLCRDALEHVRNGEEASSMTALLQGAPGVGKTSILNHLIDEWKKEARNAPYVVKVKPATLENEAALAESIIEMICPGASQTWRTEHSSNLAGKAGVAGIGLDMTGGKIVHPGLATLENIGATLRNKGLRGPRWKWDRAIVLMVDEIQSLKPPSAPMIQSLHMGLHRLPLIPLFAGLGDSLQVVQGFASGSRLTADNVFRLEKLTSEQAADVMEKMLCAYDVRGGGTARRRWTDWAVSVSDAWPQHLHNAMRAVASGLLDVRGALDDLDAGQVRKRERSLRLKAYGRRLSNSMKDAIDLVAAVMRDCPIQGNEQDGRPNQANIRAFIRRHMRLGDEAEDLSWHLPQDENGIQMDIRAFLRHLIHQGALQERDDGGFECPIPTFREFLIDKGNPVPAREHRVAPSLPEI